MIYQGKCAGRSKGDASEIAMSILETGGFKPEKIVKIDPIPGTEFLKKVGKVYVTWRHYEYTAKLGA